MIAYVCEQLCRRITPRSLVSHSGEPWPSWAPEHHSLNLSCDSRKPTNLEKGFFFLTERCGNLIENKGRLWKTLERSRNVIENKGSYALKAGMLLKRQVVSRWGKNRSQDSGFGIQEVKEQVPAVR